MQQLIGLKAIVYDVAAGWSRRKKFIACGDIQVLRVPNY